MSDRQPGQSGQSGEGDRNVLSGGCESDHAGDRRGCKDTADETADRG